MSYIKSRKHALPTARGLRITRASLLTGLVLAMPALAATTAGDGTAEAPATADVAQDLPTVEVTGHNAPGYKVDTAAGPKWVKPVLDTTQNVQIIAADLIQQQAATTLTEALRNSAGVGTFFVGENGTTNTGDAVFMRGFDSSSSIFVDGVRDLGSVSRDMFNIEQVEVIKGPSGADYGRTAPTGSLNLVSKQPMLDERVAASVAAGSAEQRRASADWNQRIDGLDGAAWRLNLMAQDSGVPGRDRIEHQRWGIAPSLAFGLGSATRVYLNLLHLRQSNVPDGGVPTVGLPGFASPDPARPQLGSAPRVDSSNYYGTTSDHDDSTSDLVTLLIEHDFSEDLRLHNTTRWGRTHQDYLLTSFMGSSANWTTPDLDDPATWTIARNLPTFKDQTNRIATNQTNLRLHSAFAGEASNDLSAGVELVREQAGTLGLAALNGSRWPAANLYHPEPQVSGLVWGRNGAMSDGRTDTIAAYLFDTVTFNPRWQLNFGLRLDHYRTDFFSLVPCGGRGPACGGLPTGSIVTGVDADKSDTLFNWKLGLLYKPAENGSLYLDYALSQQPPGGNALALSASASSPDNPIFEPEKANTFEVGTKWELLDARLLLTASLYRTDVENQIVQDPVDQLYYQSGRKRVQGVELGAVGKLSEHWSLSAGYTTMDARVDKGSAVAQDGSADLAYTPANAFTLWTTYTTPFKLTLGAGARHAGAMKRGRDGAVGTPAVIDGYWVFDAMASYPLGEHAGLQLNVYNLFDNDYIAAINKSGYRYTPGAPLSALLTLNLRF